MIVRWQAASDAVTRQVTGYRVAALQLGARQQVRRTYRTASVPAAARSVEVLLPRGRYRVTVEAVNRVGWSAPSARSAVVVAR